MSEQKPTDGSPCGAGAGDAEQPRPDEPAGFDMKQAMGRMMAHCPCGAEMMTHMAGMMGRNTASQPADSKPQEQD